MTDYPFDTPEIAELQEGYDATFTFDYSWETPIWNTLCATYRYDGGWAFEDWCPTWRPWSDAWEKLCGALETVGYPSLTDRAVVRLRAAIRAHMLSAGDTCVYCGNDDGDEMINIDQPGGSTEWWHTSCAEIWQLRRDKGADFT